MGWASLSLPAQIYRYIYGQWESKEAFENILKQAGFNPDKPYWDGLARNEFHLYNVVHTQTTA